MKEAAGSRDDRGGEAVEHRAGFCALVGLPNVGKSTLLNQLVGEELSIVTPKPQTTRERLSGILSGEDRQIVFVDTPGLLEPRYLLQEAMQEEAERALEGADVLVYVADAGYGPSLDHAREAEPPAGIPALMCLNKADRIDEGERQRLEAEFSRAPWDAVVATVAREGKGVAALREAVGERLPPSPPLYPPDQTATAPLRFFAAEFVREAAFGELAEEVPYSVAVEVEEFREDEDPVYISAVVYVERQSQKGIVIGDGGERIRAIGTAARRRMEPLLGRRVYLDLWVKVLPKWRKRRPHLSRLDFPLPGREA